MPAPKVTKASFANALSASADAGLAVSAAIFQPDGSLRLEFSTGELETATSVGPKADAPKKWGASP